VAISHGDLEVVVTFFDFMGSITLFDDNEFVALGDGLRTVIIHGDGLVVHHVGVFIVLDADRHVLFRAHVEHFLTLGIVKCQHVGIVFAAALGAVGTAAADIHLVRQFAGGCLVGVV